MAFILLTGGLSGKKDIIHREEDALKTKNKVRKRCGCNSEGYLSRYVSIYIGVRYATELMGIRHSIIGVFY